MLQIIADGGVFIGAAGIIGYLLYLAIYIVAPRANSVAIKSLVGLSLIVAALCFSVTAVAIILQGLPSSQYETITAAAVMAGLASILKYR